MAKKKGIIEDALSQIGKKKDSSAELEEVTEMIKVELEEEQQQEGQQGKLFGSEADFKKHNAINNDPEKLTADGRKRFNTMMHPRIKNRLRNFGDEHGLSIADVIEIMAKKFLDEKGY